VGTDITGSSGSPLDPLRELLLGDDRDEVAKLQARIDELDKTVAQLEKLVAETEDRARAVGEVLVDAIENPESSQLGQALKPSLEHAVHVSARDDSSVLATALYPVMGPALRKMIAELFTFGDRSSGGPFHVEQVLLIERTTGLLLASSTSEARNDADIVSGMLDAIRMFVQDAFDTTEHDGLRDLRVGDTSVLVEWGPQAVLASVTRGVPTEEYRTATAKVLEEIHFTHSTQLESFNGNVDPFNDVVPLLDNMDVGARSASSIARTSMPIVIGLVCLVLLVLLVLWIVL